MTTSSERPPRPPRRRLGAADAPPSPEVLFALLDDDSPRVWTEVRHQLIRADRSLVPALRRLAQHPAARLRARARRVLLDRERVRIFRRLAKFATRPALELERALFVLSRLETPNFDARPYRKALDALGREVAVRARRRRARGATELECARALCEYLGGELGYSGATDDYHHPDNVFLHRTIERRLGMPLTLCTLYRSVAERAGLRAALVPLPGHVLVRLCAGADNVLVDPFHGGEDRSERECLQYLAQHGLEFRSSWFRDCPDSLMFARHVANLRASWMARGLNFEVRELSRLLDALARNPSTPVSIADAL